MTEHGHIEVETSGGYRPPSSAGDRMLIGLATLALVGGALIGVGNLLSGDDDVARASPSVTASAATRTLVPRSTATPFPDPPPSRSVVPGEPDPPPQDQPTFFGWLRVIGDTEVHAGASEATSVTRELHPGDAVFAYQDPAIAWLEIDDGSGVVGYVRADDPAVEKVTSQQGPIGGDVSTLVAGAEGFLAIGVDPATTWYEQGWFVATSQDGSAWRHSAWPGALPPYGPVAWGPAGWLSVTTFYGEDLRTWASRSDDGQSWTSLGALDLSREAVDQLVASDAGYLLSTSGERFSENGRLWFTTDGVTWEERPGLPPLPGGSVPRIAAFSQGFLLWSGDRDAPIMYSTDGIRWAETGIPHGLGFVAAPWGRGVRAFDLGADGEVRAWIGSVLSTGLRWREADGRVFRGSVVAAVAGADGMAVAVGWDRRTGDPRAWVTDGSAWAASDLPDAYDGVPQQLAVGPTGAVLVGYRPTLRGENPILWHLGASGWTPESEPLLSSVADPGAQECGMPPPADAIDLWALEKARGAACFGNVPITLRAYAAACDGCRWDPPGDVEPAWLGEAYANVINLAPVPGEGGNWMGAVLAPGLEPDPAWIRKWVDVTGHFDDPAAAACHYLPRLTGDFPTPYYRSQGSVVELCRTEFVVTSVTVVDGP